MDRATRLHGRSFRLFRPFGRHDNLGVTGGTVDHLARLAARDAHQLIAITTTKANRHDCQSLKVQALPATEHALNVYLYCAFRSFDTQQLTVPYLTTRPLTGQNTRMDPVWFGIALYSAPVHLNARDRAVQ